MHGKTDDKRLPPWAVLAARQCLGIFQDAYGPNLEAAFARAIARHHAIHADQLAAALDEAIRLLQGARLWDAPEQAEPMIRMRAALAAHRSG